MTNGTLLTQDIVNYVNDNDIEVHLSYDGEHTKELRGYDILDNSNLLNLIKQIKYLRIVSVITNVNCDVMKVHNYISSKLNRPFYFEPFTIDPTVNNHDLIEGFNYDLYEKSMIQLLSSKIEIPETWCTGKGINVLLNGDVVGVRTLNKYGTVWDDKETIDKNFNTTENVEYCKNNSDCYIRDNCNMVRADACEYTCRVEHVKADLCSFLNFGGLSEYFRT
jgi:hypothetical protein